LANHQRVSASSNSPSFQQLWEALGSKLIEAAQEYLLPKQRVVSSNLITRSSFKKGDSSGQNPLCAGPKHRVAVDPEYKLLAFG
jgi:hypothetical protein